MAGHLPAGLRIHRWRTTKPVGRGWARCLKVAVFGPPLARAGCRRMLAKPASTSSDTRPAWQQVSLVRTSAKLWWTSRSVPTRPSPLDRRMWGWSAAPARLRGGGASVFSLAGALILDSTTGIRPGRNGGNGSKCHLLVQETWGLGQRASRVGLPEDCRTTIAGPAAALVDVL